MLTSGFVVYNYAHSDTCIKSRNGATIRVLGAFASLKDAQDHLREWALREPDLETRVSPMHSWRMASKSLMTLEEQEHQFLKLVEAYADSRKKVFEEVAHRAANRIGSTMPTKPVVEAEPSVVEHDDTTDKMLPRVPRILEVREQRFVGIAVLPDILTEENSLETHEPAFEFLCVADSELEIESFFRDWSSKYIVDREGGEVFGIHANVPLVCVSMYESVRPAWCTTLTSCRRVTRDQRIADLRSGFQPENKDGLERVDDSRMESVASTNP